MTLTFSGSPITVKSRNWFLFALLFVFWAFLMWCAPFSSDDLEFATLRSHSLSQVLRYVCEYGNGRFLGNLFAILMVRWPVVGIVCKALVMSACILLLPTVCGRTAPVDYLLSASLFLCIDPELFGYVYVWTSGFNNYMMPIWCTLVILWLIRCVWQPSSRIRSALICVLTFVLGVSGQLFVEHSSGVNVLLSLCASLYFLKKRQYGRFVPSLLWLIGTVIGISLMFWIPARFCVEASHSDGYRYTHMSTIASILFSCARNALKLGEHYWGANMLSVCLGANVTLQLVQSRCGKYIRLLKGSCRVCSLFLILSILTSVNGYWGEIALFQHTFTFLVMAVILAVWFAAAFFLEDKTLRYSILFCLVFALVSLAPLLLVSPIPMRVIYQSYFFVCCGALLCVSEWFQTLPQAKKDQLQKLAATCCILLTLLISTVHVSIRTTAKIREDYIHTQLQAGESTIEIFLLPYSYTVYDRLWSLPKYCESLTGNPVTLVEKDFHTWMQNFH